jgi:hypothetical protein
MANTRKTLPRKYRSDRVSIYLNLRNDKAFLNYGSYKETKRNPAIIKMIAGLTHNDRYETVLFIPTNEPEERYLIITHKYVPTAEIERILKST